MSNREDNRKLYGFLKLINKFRQVIFYVLLAIVVVVFIFNRLFGIWLAGSFFILYLVSYLMTLSSKKTLLRLVQEFLMINDNDIADKMERSLEDVRKILASLSKHQRNKKWLIVYLNKRYLFLNENGVDLFKNLYKQGYNEKVILENLQQEMKIRSRAEVKAIEMTLANYNRLNN
ncbi:MAG: hypothetical protein ACFFE4_10620 [Candidatus Thorarchaeota archaeon]